MVIINRTNFHTTHAKADVIMIKQMIHAVETKHIGIHVVADGTGMFDLLFHSHVVLTRVIDHH